MKMKIIIYLFLLLLISSFTQAQRWKRSRYEAHIGLGVANVLSDLGGADQKGTHFIKDMELSQTRPVIYGGIRYKIKEKIAIKLNLNYAWLRASDELTTYRGRENRGITTKTSMLEFSLQAEYSIIKEKLGSRYTFMNINSFSLTSVNTYLFAGFGGFYFNPKSTTTNTQPSGIVDGYSNIALAFPFGIGFKYGLSRNSALGLEYGLRYTTSDYIDNHKDICSEANDAYMFLTLHYVYKLKTSRSGLPKF